MILWVLLIAVTALTLAWVGWPLLRPKAITEERDAFDAAVYLDQLEELEKDLARGLVEDSQAEAARTEIERRLLAASRTSADPAPTHARRHLMLAGILALVIPLAALSLYAQLGSPELPDQPLAQRAPVETQTSPIVAQARERLREAEQRALASPEDSQTWFDLGRLRLVSGDNDGAVEALARALALGEERADIASAYGEAVTRQADGAVTAEARRAFTIAFNGNPEDPRARYFLALAEYQEGREENALQAWSALARMAPRNAPWLPAVEARIRETAADLGEDVADWLPGSFIQPPVAGPFAGRGPTGEDVAAAQDMSPEDRQEMIRGMVENLATRLEDEPEDVDGWRRLARSRTVLGDPGGAAEAYDRALALAPDHPETLLRGALAAAETGDTAAARDRFVRLRGLVPADSEVYRMLSQALERLDNPNSTPEPGR
jgi:cytochrome c-type biogenesis protein CcmH